MLQELGLRLGLRQRIISTAQVFFKRFYLKASFVQFDPRLVTPTVLFVAAKVEETPINAKNFMSRLNKLETNLPVNNTTNANGSAGVAGVGFNGGGGASATLVFPPAWLINASAPTAAAQAAAASMQATVAASTAAAAAAASPAVGSPSSGLSAAPAAASSSLSSVLYPKVSLPHLFDVEDLLEMEFAVVSGLNYDFIVFHPYRPLMQSVGTRGGREQGNRDQMRHGILTQLPAHSFCLVSTLPGLPPTCIIPSCFK